MTPALRVLVLTASAHPGNAARQGMSSVQFRVDCLSISLETGTDAVTALRHLRTRAKTSADTGAAERPSPATLMSEAGASRAAAPVPILVGALALVIIALALVLLARANADVEVSRARIGPTPVTVYRPAREDDAGATPVVVISHGFAGSQQLMQPFAVTLARNGYIAVTFDYLGHGRNTEALGGDVNDIDGSTRLLLRQTADVVDFALALPGAGGGLAMLGHSMASDVVVRYARSDPRVDATIAVSMYSTAVTADSPPNLLVIVGDLEGYLKREALAVLTMVTPAPSEAITYGSFADGSARRAAFADGVEHVAVLYSPESMGEAVAWLDRLYSRQGSGYRDDRGGAIVLLLFGIGLLGWPCSKLLPRISDPPAGASLGWRELLPAAVIPALLTPLALWWFPADFLSVLVGGYLAVHFGLYGLLTAACLWWIARRQRADGPGRALRGAAAEDAPVAWPAAVVATVLATAYTTGAIGLAMDAYITSFAITPPRLPLVFAMLGGTASYFLADEWLTRGARTPRGAHAFTRVCFLFSLALAVALSFEELFFLLIIAVVILIYFIVYGLFSGWIYRATGHPVIGATANAVAFAWALAVVFPMLSGS
jgi:hypothetical protein